ncbi:MAG: Dabb family protein, partial [Phycisphaerales bacterium]|nr:Dabb family protein [Phycisphaerales bacterium]
QIKQVEEAFAALKTKIPGITSLHWGTNVSPEKRNHGFTHCFVLTFATDKDRDVYLVHPEHKAFGTLLGPILGDVMVIDFSDKE